LQKSSLTTHLLKKVSTLQLHPPYRSIIVKTSCYHSFFPRSATSKGETQLTAFIHLASPMPALKMTWGWIHYSTSYMWLKPGPSVMTQIMISRMKIQYVAYRICNSHHLHVIGLEESAAESHCICNRSPWKP
jgi:hypothetical protein